MARDANAGAVYYESTKLGYLPRSANEAFTLLLYYGHTNVCEARILSARPDSDPWDQVRVGIYATDAREKE